MYSVESEKKVKLQIKSGEGIRQILSSMHAKVLDAVNSKKRANASLRTAQDELTINNLSFGITVTGPMKEKLMAQYDEARHVIEEEEVGLRSLLTDIADLQNMMRKHKCDITKRRHKPVMNLIKERARSTPLWDSNAHPSLRALVGAIPAPDSLLPKVGWEVAAFVRNLWILAKVFISNCPVGVFEVEDFENNKRYKVRRNRLIILPQWRADPLRNKRAFFPVNATVLALYPDTTCFYKGLVEKLPENADDDYWIAFADKDYPTGYSPATPVPQHYVIGHRVPRTHPRHHP